MNTWFKIALATFVGIIFLNVLLGFGGGMLPSANSYPPQTYNNGYNTGYMPQYQQTGMMLYNNAVSNNPKMHCR